MARLLEIDDLTLGFEGSSGIVPALHGVSFGVGRGECVALVGESGSGKTVTGMAVMRLLGPGARIASGSIRLDGTSLLDLPEARMRAIRGRRIAMVFQNARASLNPIRRVGDTLVDIVRTHERAGISRRDALRKVVGIMDQIGIPSPEQRVRNYPSELSGGMCQRIGIAAALACEPELIIADEPTSALDVTTQRLVMDTLIDACRERGVAVLFISHDLALASEYCDRAVVMNGGRIVEDGNAADVFTRPGHAYTRALLDALPTGRAGPDQLTGSAARPTPPAILSVIGATKHYPIGASRFAAVDDVSFDVRQSEILGIVGESGSGKTTLARIVARLIDQDDGRLVFDGADIGRLSGLAFGRSPKRRLLQMVFQDPLASLNPRFRAFDTIADPVRRLGTSQERRDMRDLIVEASSHAGLPERLLNSYPYQLSEGQRARVGIARAIVLKPKLVILDEPTSALDASLQAHVIQTILRLRAELGVAFIFVSHDLNLVRLVSDRLLVMHRGKVVEQGIAREVFENPTADHTKQLISAIPVLGRRRTVTPAGT